MRPATRSIQALFGPLARVATWREAEPPPVFPEEAAAISRSVPSRQREFACGRAAAREALQGLGLPPSAIPVGPNREPVWPNGVVGAITHCEGLVAAVVAHASRLAAVGIDAEPATLLPRETRRFVLRPGEMSTDGVTEKLVFSAKEALYKAVFPLAGVWIDFHEVEISLDRAAGMFSAAYEGSDERLSHLVALMSGRFFRSEEYLVTASYLQRTDEGSR